MSDSKRESFTLDQLVGRYHEIEAENEQLRAALRHVGPALDAALDVQANLEEMQSVVESAVAFVLAAADERAACEKALNDVVWAGIVKRAREVVAEHEAEKDAEKEPPT